MSSNLIELTYSLKLDSRPSFALVQALMKTKLLITWLQEKGNQAPIPLSSNGNIPNDGNPYLKCRKNSKRREYCTNLTIEFIIQQY